MLQVTCVTVDGLSNSPLKRNYLRYVARHSGCDNAHSAAAFAARAGEKKILSKANMSQRLIISLQHALVDNPMKNTSRAYEITSQGE
ncbi:MAG: hypothetical protein ABI386_07910 [Rhodanobacter sp.]